MSTIVLNPKSISKLSNSYLTINGATHNRYQTSLERILKKAYDLNIKSWNLRYPNEETITEDQQEKFYKVDFKSKERFNNPYEVLVTLQKLRYNIDSQAIKEKSDRDTRDILDIIIEDIKNYIITNTEEYKNINYGDI